MAAGETFRPNEIGEAKVLDPSSVKRHHRRAWVACSFLGIARNRRSVNLRAGIS
jgi:hypothetical protein